MASKGGGGSSSPVRIKPWHSTTAATTRGVHDIQVEVFAPASRPPMLPSNALLETSSRCITLSCGNSGEEEGEKEFVVSEEIARCSGLVRSILDSSGNFIEQQLRKIHLGEIEGHILQQVILFCQNEYIENPSLLLASTSPTTATSSSSSYTSSISSPTTTTSSSASSSSSSSSSDATHLESGLVGRSTTTASRISFLFGISPDIVMDLLAAAHYLQIPSLAQYAISMLAEYADDIPSFEGVSSDMVQEVCNRCKPEALHKLEKQKKLDGLDVNTTCLWKRFCDQRDWSDVVSARQKEETIHRNYYSGDLAARSGLNREHIYVDVDWRRGYAELSLEYMIAKLGYGSVEAKDFMDFVELYGDVITSLKVDPDTLTLADIKFDSLLVENFNNLQVLELAGNLAGYLSQLCRVISHYNTQLRVLHLRCCKINDEVLTSLLDAVALSKLDELDLSGNMITSVGICTLVERMPNGFFMPYLNLSCNPIGIGGFLNLCCAKQTGDVDADSCVKRRIRVLNVSDCKINLAKAKDVISQAGERTLDLCALDISSNSLSKHTSRFWKHLLENNTTLQELNIGRCSLTDRSISRICPVLEATPSLVSLDMSENLFRDSSVVHIADLLKNPNCAIAKLDLSGNVIRDEGAQLLAHSLAVNTSLVELVLSRLLSSAVGIQAIDNAVARNKHTSLRRIWLLLHQAGAMPSVLLNRGLFVTHNSSPAQEHFQIRWGGTH